MQCLVGFAQKEEIDSLKKILPSLHDTARINCLIKLGEYYCNHKHCLQYSRTDSAELCNKEAGAEAAALNYKLGLGNAFLHLAEINRMRNNLLFAQNYAEKAISIFKEIKNESLLNQAYIMLADALLYQGEFTREQNYLELALEYYKKVKDTLAESSALAELSYCYTWKGNFEKGYQYLQEQLNLIKNLPNSAGMLKILLEKQEIYDMAGWYDSVASYSTRIVALKEKMGIDTGYGNFFQYFKQHKWDSALYYNNQMRNSIESNKGIDSILKKQQILRIDFDMVSIYQRVGKYEEALPVFLKGLENYKERNYVVGELEALLNISQLYQLEGKNNDAIKYAQNLLTLAQKTEGKFFILNATKLLWEIYDKKKDSAIAYKYYLKYTAVKDSTINGTYERNLAVINELSNEREQQAQIALLNKDNKLKETTIEKNVLLRNILVAGVIILILLVSIIFRAINLKRKNEKLEKVRLQYLLDMEHIENEKKQFELQNKATQLEIQALRAQMNPHFIFNCLNSINRFIINNDAAQAADYLTKFAKLIRIVLQQSGKPFIPLEDELKCLELYMDLEALRFETPFTYEISCDGIDTSFLMIPTLLIQPFVENAIWHGLHSKTNGNGKINICIHVKDDIMHCKICDNGIGRLATIKLETDTAKKSLGINLTEHRLQLIDPLRKEKVGIEIHDLINEAGNNAGTCVDVKIPVTYT